jgi:phage-related protein
VKEYAQIDWVGDAKDVLSAFPQQIKGVFGYSLHRLQKVLLPDCDARQDGVSRQGVWKLKTADERTWYRVIDLTQIGDELYVLHAFEKSSRKTDRRDLEIAKSCLKSVLVQLRTTSRSRDHDCS